MEMNEGGQYTNGRVVLPPAVLSTCPWWNAKEKLQLNAEMVPALVRERRLKVHEPLAPCVLLGWHAADLL